ncbi:MAG TPA: hypothetical protein PLU47_00935 [Azonexus sp.]|nr:hypothetical protein [Azonexus sp.]
MAVITEIRTAAQRLADARRESTTRATALEHALAQAAQPIYQSHRAGIDAAATDEAEAYAELLALVETSPGEFKRPRSLLVDGVKTGYRKEQDGLDYDSEEAVIARIFALEEFSGLAQALVRIERHLNIEAVETLEARQRRLLGIRTVTGADQPFISFSDTDVEKLVKAILADAQKRQGDQADAGAAKKSKKRKEVA